jgi:hypothetical protein
MPFYVQSIVNFMQTTISKTYQNAGELLFCKAYISEKSL